MQNAIIIGLFIAALGYVGSLFYKAFTKTKGCASNCGKCKASFDNVNVKIKNPQ